MADIDQILTRGVINIIPSKKELEDKLKSEKLNIYFGIDPTATKIHLGHAVPLRKLQKFAELGHNVTFLIGDFTALIGDSSDKNTERPFLTSEQIEENFKTYKKQAEKIIDFSKIKVRYNKKWLSKLGFEDIIKLTQKFSVGDFISRELIKKRLSSGLRVGLHEVLYPVIQGYDSYFLNSDLQIGGTDQTFNMQAGRTLQKILRNKTSYILTTAFLTGTDGRKMSKSWGNAIWLDDSPNDMYAKIMAILDNLIIEYFTLSTDVSMDKIEQISRDIKNGKNPMSYKKILAFEIVKQLNSHESAHKAQENFEKTVQNKEQSLEILVVSSKSGSKLSEIAIKEGLVASNSEWKRLIDQGGIKKNNEQLKNTAEVLSDETILQRGRKIIRIKPK